MKQRFGLSIILVIRNFLHCMSNLVCVFFNIFINILAKNLLFFYNTVLVYGTLHPLKSRCGFQNQVHLSCFCDLFKFVNWFPEIGENISIQVRNYRNVHTKNIEINFKQMYWIRIKMFKRRPNITRGIIHVYWNEIVYINADLLMYNIVHCVPFFH